MSDLPKHLAVSLLNAPKFCAGEIEWVERTNHAGRLISTSVLEDDTGATIPGLTMQLEIKRPVVVDRCLYEFGLFLLEKGVRRRVYQLNVTPANKLSHNGVTGPIYGPHEHIGDEAVALQQSDIECGKVEAAFAHYCTRINLRYSRQFRSPL